MEFSLGSDPELIIKYQDQAIGAIGRVPPKYEPAHLPSGGKLYADNLNVELQVPPASSREEWLQTLSVTLSEARRAVGDYELVAEASCEYPAEDFQSEDAFVVGCRPEFSVYDIHRGRVKRIAPPRFDRDSRLRTCGGHLHIGYENCRYDPVRYVKGLDFVVGIASVLLDNDPNSPIRRSLYGGAGYHRPTPYGLEYRTPGNFWISSPTLAGLVYGLVEETLHLEYRAEDEFDIPTEEVVAAINNHDKPLAQEVWDRSVKQYMSRSLIKDVEEASKTPHCRLYETWEDNDIKLAASA